MNNRPEILRELMRGLRRDIVDRRMEFLSTAVEDGIDGTEFDLDVLNLLREMNQWVGDSLEKLMEKYK